MVVPATNATVDDVLKLTSKFPSVNNAASAAVGSGPAIVFSGGIGDNQTRDRARIVAVYEDSNVSGLAFHTQDTADIITEKVRFRNNGNVGIGTTTPRGDLDVGTATASAITKSIHLGYSAADFYGFRLTNINTAASFGAGTFSIQRGSTAAWTSDFLMDNTGKVSIAEGNAPTQVLSIYRGGSTQTVMSAGNSTTGLNGSYFGVDTAGNAIINQTQALAMIFSTSGTERARITSGGNFGIGNTAPTDRLSVNGNVYVSGTLTEASSIALKENIDPITGALSVILGINGYTYDRKDGSRRNEPGLIAEEVAEVLPNIIQRDDQGNPSGVQYTKIIAYLVESIKELKTEIDSLKKNNGKS